MNPSDVQQAREQSGLKKLVLVDLDSQAIIAALFAKDDAEKIVTEFREARVW